MSMKINNVPIDCKQLFRDALDSLVSTRNMENNVSIIRYKTWNNDYLNDQKHLYLNDGLHLNKYGYAILDSVISNEILNQLTPEHSTEPLMESGAFRHRL